MVNKYYKLYIKINKKFIHLGNFKTIEEAAIVRQKAAIKYFGEYLNECERN